MHQDPGKKAKTKYSTGPDLPASIAGSTVEEGVMAVAHRGDRDTGGGSSGEFSLARALWKAAIFSPRLVPTQKPVGANVGKPQAKESKYVFLQPHPSAHTLFNVFLSTQLPTNHTP